MTARFRNCDLWPATCDPWPVTRNLWPVTCGLDPLKLQLLTDFTSLQQDCPNLKVVKARLLALVQLRTQGQASNWLLVGWAMNTSELLKFKSLRWPKPLLLSERYCTGCKCCLSIFTKIKLLIVNRDSSMVFSVVVLLLQYYFSLRNIFWCISLKNSLGWEFVYFVTCFVGI